MTTARFCSLLVILLPLAIVPSPLDCRGSDLIDPDIWTLARGVDTALQHSHVRSDILETCSKNFFMLLHSDLLEAAVADCALGVAALVAMAVPEREKNFGIDEARKLYMLHVQLLQQYGHFRNANGFAWGLETQQSAAYPMLLGLAPQRCGATALRVFVYETGLALHPLGCSQGMFATEVYVHRFLLNSDCRTEDPSEADIFFVPIYSSCMEKRGASSAEIDAAYVSLVKSLPYFGAKGGRDHIFLFSSEFYDFPSWREHIQSSMLLAVEATPIECDKSYVYSEETADQFGEACYHCHSCFSPSKDVVIPGYVENWSIRKMRAVDRVSAERELTACYHGADSTHIAIYSHANATARNELQHLRDFPNVSIGYRIAKITDYFSLIGKCHFCFVPKGLGYWSNRLYEVMFAGCIPVILSDHIGLPFDDILDWDSFSIRWPMHDITPRLLHHLEDMLQSQKSRVADMHMRVRLNRCWLDYSSEDPACSPYIGILRSLEKRALFSAR